MTLRELLILSLVLLGTATCARAQQAQRVPDSDGDGIRDAWDDCPKRTYAPGFDAASCGPQDLNPNNDASAECRARERVANALLNSGVFATHIAFSIVKDGRVHYASAFEYLGAGQWTENPEGIHRLYRIGSTTKALTAVTAKILEERGVLSLDDFVSDEDASQIPSGGERRLRDLLSHRGAFKLDAGSYRLFCYPGDLLTFWGVDDDTVSPHYDSAPYGNLGGGYEYSAFNFSLAGAYLSGKSFRDFGRLVEENVFERSRMCTATFDARRARTTAIGSGWGVSESAVMDIGPAINLYAPGDPYCDDNFYSSNAVFGDDYDWQVYHLDEATAVARDPAGGAIASVVDMAHFARELLASYHGTGDLLSPAGVRELWGGLSDLGCGGGCPYERYYGMGFFTATLPGQPVTRVEHGGSRAGYASAFCLRPEDNDAVAILANADISTVALSNVAKAILNDL